MDASENDQHDDQHDGQRAVPGLMAEAWDTAVGDPDPLVALGATRALKAHLSLWEARLVQEAVRAGATWEAVGGAVGVSRQAAWQRFHDEAHERRHRARAEARGLRDRYREEARELRRKLEQDIRDRRPRGHH